jgi:hypothetical protein
MTIRNRLGRLKRWAAKAREQDGRPRVVLYLPYNALDPRLPGRYPVGPNIEMAIYEPEEISVHQVKTRSREEGQGRAGHA